MRVNCRAAAVNVVALQESKVSVGSRNIFCIIMKKESGPHWPRLLKQAGHPPKYIHVDWNKYKDEEDEDEEKANAFDLSSMEDLSKYESNMSDSDDEELPDVDGPVENTAETPTEISEEAPADK
eukprot:jgi/Mesvir1/5829/Mv00624-RA.1